MGFYRILGNAVAKKNILLQPKHNSVISDVTMTEYPDGEGRYLTEAGRSIGTAIGKHVALEVNTIREVVLPVYRDIVNKTNEVLAGLPSGNKLTKLRVNVVQIPDIVDELYARGLVVTTELQRREIPNYGVKHSIGSDVKRLATYTSPVLDNLLRPLLGEYTESEFAQRWGALLENLNRDNPVLVNILYSGVDAIGDVIITHALLSNLNNELPLKYNGDPTNYKILLRSIIDELAAQINRLVIKYTGDVRLGKLINNSTSEEISINHDVFQEALKHTTMDAIMGFMLTNDITVSGSRYLKQFLSRSSDYEKIYTDAYAVEELKEEYNKAPHLQRAVKLAVKEVVATVDDAFKELMPKCEDDLEKLSRGVRPPSTTDVEFGVLYIMSDMLEDSIFFYNYMFKLLALSKNHPTLDKDTIATMAAIEVCVDYILRQVDEVKIT